MTSMIYTLQLFSPPLSPFLDPPQQM